MQSEKQLMEDLENINLRDLLAVIFRWKWLIVLLTLASIVTAGVLSYFILPPIYEAKTMLLVTQGESKQVQNISSDDLESLMGSLSRLPQMTINTYVEQVKNPTILNRTIQKLGLEKEGYTAGGLGGLLAVRTLKDTNLIEINVENTDAYLAKDIANVLSCEVLNFISESNQNQMSKSVEFLQEQYDAVKIDLMQVNEQLDELESVPDNYSFLKEEKASKTKDLMSLRSDYLQAQINYQELQAGIEKLKERLANTPLQLNILDESTNVFKNISNPDYIRLQGELDAKELAVAEKQAQLSGLNSNIKTLEKEIAKLQSEIVEKESATNKLQKELVELEKTGSLLSEKITQTKISKSINLGETSLQVISKAALPIHPVKPKKTFNMMIAAILGFMISTMLAFLLEFMDNTIKNAEEVENKLGLPVLGSIPRYGSKKLKDEVKANGH